MKSIIIHGPQASGKTTFASAIADTHKAPVIVGQSKHMLTKIQFLNAHMEDDSFSVLIYDSLTREELEELLNLYNKHRIMDEQGVEFNLFKFSPIVFTTQETNLNGVLPDGLESFLNIIKLK